MMFWRQVHLCVWCLLTGLSVVSAQQIWHKSDSLLSMPICDSILPTEEYTIIAVLKSNVPDSVQLLWGIRSNDTLQSADKPHSISNFLK